MVGVTLQIHYTQTSSIKIKINSLKLDKNIKWVLVMKLNPSGGGGG